MFDTFIHQSISIFAIVDPIGAGAFLLSLASAQTTNRQISQIAFKTTSAIVIAFLVVFITGDFILKAFGINIHSLKVMGGIILLLMAIKMVQGHFENKNQSKEEQEEAKEFDDFAIIPLAIPTIFGPGIFATIVIYRNAADSIYDLLSLALSFCLTALVVFLSLRYSIYIKQFLGITGQKIITRLMGIIVGAIAIQFIVGGIKSLWM